MLSANYAALGKRQWGNYCMLASLVIFVIFSLATAGWEGSPITTVVVIIGQVVITLFVTNQLQGSMFKTFEELGGRYYSNWRAVAVGMIASLIMLVAMITLVLVFGTVAQGA